MVHSFRRRLLASTLLVGSAMGATPVLAQDASAAVAPATAAPAPAATGPSSGEIVVTGSLIRNPNLVSASPVGVIGSNEISLRQADNAEQLLRDMPGVVPDVGSAVNNGNGGFSELNLRGLGSNRNLVLLDGNRIVPDGINGAVDLNNIPVALIERTEVLTGGASTTYGADAIAGVVNFITKKDFSGIDANVSEGLTQRGDGNRLRAEVTVGGNFDDDKGNAVIAFSYQKDKPVYQGDRKFSYYALDSYTGNISGSGTTFPSRLVGLSLNPSEGETAAAAAAGLAAPTSTTIFSGSRQINPTTGALDAYTQPYNFNPLNIFQTPFKRFNIYGAAHYNISDNVEFYTRGMYSKNTVSTILAESGLFGLSVDIPLSNPYLPAAAATQICNGAGLSAAECVAARGATSTSDPNYRTFTAAVGRRAIEAGPRITNYTTNTFDYRAGLRGDLSDHLHWDVNGSYGETDQNQVIKGNTLNSHFQDALLATNTSTCLSGTAGCVPVNIFGGDGSITSNMLSYLQANSFINTHTSLAQIHGALTGELPVTSPMADNPISFAIGGEYRRYTASVTSDSLSKSGDIGGSGGATPDVSGAYSVYEGFGELDAPLVEHKPFFDLLSVNLGIRRSQYSVETTGNPGYGTTTWKATGVWSPVHDIKFRGGYQHAVRAPNINELFAPVNTVLTNLGSDPCAGAAPTASANLAAVCLAQGAPASSIGAIPGPDAGQVNERVGGSTSLKPETSNSITAGAVFTPSFVPGLSVTVDYFNIKVKNAITAATPADLITACFGADPASVGADAATSAACTIIRRSATTGSLSGDSTQVGGLYALDTNSGKLKTDGIDLTANYARSLGFAKLNLSFNGTWTHSNKFQASPVSINRDCVGYFSVNCASPQPEFQWNQRTTLSFKKLDLSLLWRHIGKLKYEPADAAANGDLYSGTLAAATGLSGNYDFNKIKAYNYFDFTARVQATDNLELTATVYNLADKKPPLVGYDVGSSAYNSGNTYPSTYDTLGRSFQVTAHVKF